MACVSLAAAVFPMLAYLAFIWWMDRYDREPLWLVAIAFFWGAMGGILLGCLGTLLLSIPSGALLSPTQAKTAMTVAWAPLAEETAKGLVLLAIFWNRKFDNLTDGMVYGSATGLGFAMTENFLYFVMTYQEHGWAGLAGNIVIRTGFSGVTHCIASATFGATLGLVKFGLRGPVRVLLPLGGMVGAMGIHGVWNALALQTQTGGGAAFLLVGMALTAGEVTVLLVLLQWSLQRESRMIRAELSQEAQAGNIPAGHLAILPNYFRRNRSGWLAPGVDRKRYVELATQLAFRRWQVGACAPEDRPGLETEVRALRLQIHQVLAGLLPPPPGARPPAGPPPRPPTTPSDEPPLARLVEPGEPPV